MELKVVVQVLVELLIQLVAEAEAPLTYKEQPEDPVAVEL
jgi:hypothetical protein